MIRRAAHGNRQLNLPGPASGFHDIRMDKREFGRGSAVDPGIAGNRNSRVAQV